MEMLNPETVTIRSPMLLRLISALLIMVTPFTVNAAEVRHPLQGVAEVDAGFEFSCALTTTGGVKCWGGNDKGQLGDGTTISRSLPADVSGLGAGVLAVSTGQSHACALTSTGGVKCWGNNLYGQLGDGSTTGRSSPGDVIGMTSNVIAVSAGYKHTCALSNAGGVKCWGDNGRAQLGNGSILGELVPVDVSGLSSGIAAISSGGEHTCALTTGGAMKCWGNDSVGQLGDGTPGLGFWPTDVIGLASGTAAISVGGQHTCALTTSGGMKCWGMGLYGQLGDGFEISRSTPVDVVGMVDMVIAISLGDGHSCALKAGNQLLCWGSNFNGELGIGTVAFQPVPTSVHQLPSTVATMSLGQSHMCATTTTHGAVCWGLNASGQLGDGTTSTQLRPRDVPGTAGMGPAIGGGGAHTCAITSIGGVRCWGKNDYGQLGDGSTSNRQSPVDVSGLSSGVSAIHNGARHSCALTAAGGVKCWGANYAGQLGDGSTVNRPTPVDASGLTGGVSTMAAGSDHSCAVTTAGAVKCWGLNNHGQLGDGGTVTRPTPYDVTGLGQGVTLVAAGFFHTCASLAGGGAKCWGQNQRGQIGDGTTTTRLLPSNASGLAAEVTALSCGYYHTCAAVSGGGMRCWGANNSGQVGTGSTANQLIPTAVWGLTGEVDAIAGGFYHTCALMHDSSTQCWGYNAFGQLGNGNVSNRWMPAAVIGLSSGVVGLGAGANHSCATTLSGEVKCWGSNQLGQLGLGGRDYTLPGPVLDGDILLIDGFDG